MTIDELLKISHAYLRGSVINDTTGVYTIDRDTLARQINLYINEVCNAPSAEKHPSSSQPEQPPTD